MNRRPQRLRRLGRVVPAVPPVHGLRHRHRCRNRRAPASSTAIRRLRLGRANRNFVVLGTSLSSSLGGIQAVEDQAAAPTSTLRSCRPRTERRQHPLPGSDTTRCGLPPVWMPGTGETSMSHGCSRPISAWTQCKIHAIGSGLWESVGCGKRGGRSHARVTMRCQNDKTVEDQRPQRSSLRYSVRSPMPRMRAASGLSPPVRCMVSAISCRSI